MGLVAKKKANEKAVTVANTMEGIRDSIMENRAQEYHKQHVFHA